MEMTYENNKQILADFYKLRKAKPKDDKNVLLERFVTNTYLKKYIKPNSSVIEIGAGIRAYTPEIAVYAKNIVAVDLFQENLDVLKGRVKRKNFYTLCGDARDLSTVKSGCFDVVFVNGPMSHLFNDNDRIRAVKEACRICKRGGVVLFNYLTNTPIIYRAALIKGDMSALKKYTKRTPHDIYATYFVDDFHRIVSKTKMRHITDISLDGLFEVLKEYANRVSTSDFNAIKQMQLQICERPDMIGCASHVLSIYRK